MPTYMQHVYQAERNEYFLASFDPATTQHGDWAITIAFYTALHMLDAYLATRQVHPDSHFERIGKLLADPKLQSLRVGYLRLYKESRSARYDCRPVLPDRAAKIIQGVYAAPRGHLLGLL